MTHRIAIASSDGKYIDLHFGHADRFIIADVDGDGYSVKETRPCEPACRGGDPERHDFGPAANLLADCEAVFVSRVGPAAARELLVRGVRVFEAPYFIQDVLDRIVGEGLLDKGEEEHGNAAGR